MTVANQRPAIVLGQVEGAFCRQRVTTDHSSTFRHIGATCRLNSGRTDNPREMVTVAERRFPAGIRIALPPEGLGQRHTQITAWLDENCGADGWAIRGPE